MLWMAFMTVQPADRPGTGLLAYSLAYGRQQHRWTLPRGGSAELPLALARLIEAHGGTIVTGARMSGLVLENGECVGVETRTARPIAQTGQSSRRCTQAPGEMAPREAWGEELLYGVDRWREGVCLFPTHYATTAAPTFPVAAAR